MNTKIEELIARINLEKALEDRDKKRVLWIFAIVGAIAAIAGIAALVYKFLTPDYIEDIDDDFDDDFDDFFDDEEESEDSKEEKKEAEEKKDE